MTDLTARQVVGLLNCECAGWGAMTAFAVRHGIPVSVVSETLAGKREVGEAIANALGLVRVVAFRPLKLRTNAKTEGIAA
jgi:hypothetical protein